MDDSKVRIIEKFIQSNKIKLVGTFSSFKDKKFTRQKFEAFENGTMKLKEFIASLLEINPYITLTI